MSKILIDEATVKLALEALEQIKRLTGARWALENNYAGHLEAITALREALAEQPAQQEPVGKKTRIGLVTSAGWDSLPVGTEFYTSPPAQRTWVGLTDDEIYSVLENLQIMHHRPPTTDSRVIFARAIEAKLKEENT